MVGAVDAVLATAHARPGSEMKLELLEGMAGVVTSRRPCMCSVCRPAAESLCLLLKPEYMCFSQLPGS